MVAVRRLILSSACLATLALAGCRGIDPPYPPSQPPEPSALMTATAPSMTAIQIPRAKVRQGAGPAANLMLVAQAPGRFSGTIQVSGNELVTLVVNEEAYGLRWIGAREGAATLQPGYYSGPPSRCAVETLLGVDLEPEAFVGLILGGAPTIDEPHQFIDRKWDRKAGRERLRLANDRFEQELEFAWLEGHWQFVGASLWALGGAEPQWLWTISHEGMRELDGELVPSKTQIRQPKPNGKGELTINVSYQKQVVNPSLGGTLSPDPPLEGAGPSDEPVNAGDGWDDDWGDDAEGW